LTVIRGFCYHGFMEKYDEETGLFIEGAKEDLQIFLANAGRETTEKELEAWQSGYLAGVNRAMGIRGV
jgi:hypothetical protein